MSTPKICSVCGVRIFKKNVKQRSGGYEHRWVGCGHVDPFLRGERMDALVFDEYSPWKIYTKSLINYPVFSTTTCSYRIYTTAT